MSLDGDAARLRRGAALDADVQDAVFAAGFDLFGIGIVGQGHHAAERTVEAFVDVNRGLLVGGAARLDRTLALAGDGQQSALEGHFDRGRVDAGRIGIDLDRLRGAADIHGRKAVPGEAADGGRQIEGLLHLALQAIHLGEDVAGEKGSVHGEYLRWLGGAPDDGCAPTARS
ncbi:hypothetical protein VARIO8X_160202 [Burkholderiales bacterium 8X]|nr:hypothetical protein VARIO8X_160202 [Burkholderiales bacterium 8X]